MKNCNLVLHCGGEAVERATLKVVPTPRATATWTPIPHILLVEEVERAIGNASLQIIGQAHALSHSGDRYFGLMQLTGPGPTSDYAMVLGLRNSHDKRFPAGFVAGAQVFVCDNLAFSGEVSLTRRHTRHILRDLPLATSLAIGHLREKWHALDERIGYYRSFPVRDHQAHDLLIRAVDVGVCPVSAVPRVLDHWRRPPHEVFRERNLWSLFNGFTGALKGNLPMLPRRTIALHALLDGYAGIGGPNG